MVSICICPESLLLPSTFLSAALVYTVGMLEHLLVWLIFCLPDIAEQPIFQRIGHLFVDPFMTVHPVDYSFLKVQHKAIGGFFVCAFSQLDCVLLLLYVCCTAVLFGR